MFSEFSITDQNSWKFVSPILAANGGWAVFNFTPRGMNHAFDLLTQARSNPKWFTEVLTVDNTTVFTPEALLEEKRNNPRDLFEQEYYCKFVAGENSVFKDWRQCIEGTKESPTFGHQYICGIDLARSFDRTVIIVADMHKNKVVYYEVLENMTWESQKYRITRVISTYNNCQTIMDATGSGDAFVEQLQNMGLPIEAFKISGNQVKKGLIEKLQMFLENKYITFPHWDMLEEELDAYTYGLSPSGVVTFSAPSGMHDDAVVALALLVWRMYPQPIPYIPWTPRDDMLNRTDPVTGYLL